MSDQNNSGNSNGNSHEPKRPEAVFRDGNMSATMWRNPGQYGDRFTTVLEKSYKDEKTGEWRKTNQLSGTELLRGSFLLSEAYQKDTELKRDQSRSRSQNKGVEEARNSYREQSESMDKGGAPTKGRTQTR
jgi:hypothetical protein